MAGCELFVVVLNRMGEYLKCKMSQLLVLLQVGG